jgi:hypothetical protein
MVVDVAATPVGRREIAALVGALAGLGLAATGCASPGAGDQSGEMLGSHVEALTGTALAWVDTVLGAVPPNARSGDLATKNSANLGGAAMVVAKGCVTAGDGGGGLFYWDSTLPAASDNGGTVIVPTAGGGCWKRVFSGAISLMWFGAKGDGTGASPTGGGVPTSGDETAIRNALAAAIALAAPGSAPLPVTGAGRTYGVFGGDLAGVSRNIVLPADIQLQDATFKQLAWNAANVRTLTSAGGNNIKLLRVKVDRNGTGSNGGDQFSAAGIYIIGGSGHHFEDVEVWGNDKGSGFVVWDASKFDVVRLHVRDIKYSGAATGLRVQGFWFNNCSDFRVIAPKVHDLGSISGTTEFSRNLFGGCTDFSLIDAQVWNVDQGICLDGSAGNQNFRVLGGSARDCYSVGFRFANSARGGVVTGATTERCGQYGFVASGRDESSLPFLTGDITFVDCLALDTGSTGVFVATPPAGFAVQKGSLPTDLVISPLGIRFVNCSAIDRQEATPEQPSAHKTMNYGFVSGVPPFWPEPVLWPGILPQGGLYNECINCVSIGHTVSPTKGMHRAFCQVKLTASQSLATSGAWTPVNWNGEDHDEGAMHGGGSGTNKYIYARQPGMYEVIVSLEFAFNITGGRGLRLLKNDAPITGTVLRRPPSTTGGDETRIVLTWQVLCAAGDKLSVDAFQQSGGPLDLTTGSRMIATKIHNTGPEGATA